MSNITIADTAHYASNKKVQAYGVLFSTLLPICLALEFYKANDKNLPQILDNEQASSVCVQESYDNTALTQDGFYLNLSRAEIDACAISKIEQSEQAQATYLKDRKDNVWKILPLAGLFSAASLVLAGSGFVFNRRLRREKPGIEKIRDPGRFAYARYF